MPRKGGKRTKTRTHEAAPPSGVVVSEEKDVPRSIVARTNKVSPNAGELIKDIRKLMNPYTAMNLKEKRFNRMKDYAAVAGQLGVSHLLLLSQTDTNLILRLARYADGPTLHFKINQYTLSRQVKASQRKPFDSQAAFMTPPLVVLNNFSQATENHIKLMKVTFQHMFPTINIKTVRLNECRRVVLFHLNEENGIVEMRHYAIRANPVGMNKVVKRIIQAKIPNLGVLEDISEYVTSGGAGLASSASGMISDSEGEDEQSRITLPDVYIGKGNIQSQQSAMKLAELGPRITLELFKVEQGVNEGDVLYHKFIHKTPEEASKLKARIEKEKKLKAERRTIQESNVKRKREEMEKLNEEKAEKKRRKLESLYGTAAVDGQEEENDDNDDGDEVEEEEEEEEEGKFDEEDADTNDSVE